LGLNKRAHTPNINTRIIRNHVDLLRSLRIKPLPAANADSPLDGRVLGHATVDADPIFPEARERLDIVAEDAHEQSLANDRRAREVNSLTSLPFATAKSFSYVAVLVGLVVAGCAVLPAGEMRARCPSATTV
jgi:hypothetical protein